MTQANTAIQRLNSNQIMSAVTIHQQTVYLSGQVPNSTDLDVRGQTLEVFAKIEELLALANTDKSQLLSAQLFVKHLDDFANRESALGGMVTRSWHAGTCHDSGRFLVNPDWLIEIAVIAAQA